MTKDATHAISGEIWGRRKLGQYGSEPTGTAARIEKLIQQSKQNDVAGTPRDPRSGPDEEDATFSA